MWDQNFSFSTIIFSTMFSHEFKNGYEMTFFLKWFTPFQNTKKKKVQGSLISKYVISL